MSKRFPWTPIAALALTLGSTLAMAQSGGGSTGANATAAGARGGSGTSASPRDKAALPSKPGPERTQRASRIIGMDVVNRHGQKIGDVEDILLDADGNVTYAVVSTGGFLGMGDRLHAVPWHSLHRNSGTDHFLLDVDTDKLRSAPGFDPSSFPDFNDPKWSSENRRHFPAGSAPSGHAPGRTGAAAGTRSTSGPPTAASRAGGTSAGRSGSGNDIGPSNVTSGRSGPAAGTGGRSGTSTTAADPGSTAGMTNQGAPNERRPPMPGSGGGTANPMATQPGGSGEDQPVGGHGRDPAGNGTR